MAEKGKAPAGTHTQYSTPIQVGGDPEDHPSDPGLVCLECGTQLSYSGRGRRPRYCSSSCRHRAWERRRAAAEGLTAKEVVELPALPTGGYDRDGVARWLARDPERIVAVAAVMARTRTLSPVGTIEALGKAMDRVRGFSSGQPTTALEKHLEQQREAPASAASESKRYTELLGEYEQLAATTERLRMENTRLRDALVDKQSDLTPDGRSSLAKPPEVHPASSTTPEPPAGYKLFTMGGKTFHLPDSWSRQQCRQWCRAHPERAI